ncbi:MAG: tRNA pseudouridine(55) synthase TruB [Clostridia bacterium]|nr:tRNA pseudouridine(55) synthase TruB [Clostridia bacterium]
MKGFVNINKPTGMTSSDVVVKVRGILRRATGEKQKVGHLGTLDPLATGVLPIAVGNATRLFDYMQNKKKVYIATFKFGEETDTLDRGGKIVYTNEKRIEKSDTNHVIGTLIGEIEQMPPQYSAKSVGGKRAYDIAREGGVADLKPKKVNIYDIELLCDDNGIINLPSGKYSLSENEFAFRIVCGSGTYIRAIARDMAHALGTVGYMSSLCRTNTGGFDLDNAVTIEQFEKNPLEYVLPIDIALTDYEKVDLDAQEGAKALNGVKIPYDKAVNSSFAVSVCQNIVGLGEITKGMLRLTVRL